MSNEALDPVFELTAAEKEAMDFVDDGDDVIDGNKDDVALAGDDDRQEPKAKTEDAEALLQQEAEAKSAQEIQTAIELDANKLQAPDFVDYASKITALSTDYNAAKTEAKELKEKYDDGELDDVDYESESKALERKIIRLEVKIEALEESEAEQAAKIEAYNERVKALWEHEQEKFFALPENQPFLKNQKLILALNGYVEELLAENPAPNQLANVLVKARQMYVADQEAITGVKSPLPKPSAAPTPKKPNKAVELPPTLSDIPAAIQNADGDDFAYLDRLSGRSYEDALAKLSPEQKIQYMERG